MGSYASGISWGTATLACFLSIVNKKHETHTKNLPRPQKNLPGDRKKTSQDSAKLQNTFIDTTLDKHRDLMLNLKEILETQHILCKACYNMFMASKPLSPTLPNELFFWIIRRLSRQRSCIHWSRTGSILRSMWRMGWFFWVFWVSWGSRVPWRQVRTDGITPRLLMHITSAAY